MVFCVELLLVTGIRGCSWHDFHVLGSFIVGKEIHWAKLTRNFELAPTRRDAKLSGNRNMAFHFHAWRGTVCAIRLIRAYSIPHGAPVPLLS